MKDIKNEILYFWFEETSPQQWFYKDPDFDILVRERFLTAYKQGAKGAYDSWAVDADGALALIILLDQMPRHMFRNKPESFASDLKALKIAQDAVKKGFDQILSPVKRGFLYIPFQHSEDIVEQDRSLQLYGAMRGVNPTGYDYAKRHRDVIAEYGRFPHRNVILGRANTKAEEEYLARPGSGF